MIELKSKLKLLTISMKCASSLFKPLTNLGLSSTGLDSTLLVSQSVSHSVTQQKADLEDGSLPKVETSINLLHWTL